MTQERRKTNRLPIDVKISLKAVGIGSQGEVNDLSVDVVNISRGGIAFVSSAKLSMNTYFDTTITLWTKEKIDTVVEIMRMEDVGDDGTLYGCRFIGLQSSEQLKIQIYEMVSEIEKQGL